MPHTGGSQQRGIAPPAGDLAGVGQRELGRYAHASKPARDMRGPGPAVDLRAGGADRNGIEIPRLESAEDAAARIDGRLPQNRALDPPDALWTAGPLRSHTYAQVRLEPIVRARGECVSRSAT